MMSEAIRGLWSRPWLTLSGLVLGVLLVPTLSYSVSALTDLYYTMSPITQLSGKVVGADAREVVVHLRAEKRYAPGCQYVTLRANTVDVDNERERAMIERIDQPAIGEGLPVGTHDLGLWRIVPRSDGVAVIVWPLYECGGRVIWSGSVVLPIPPA